MYGYYDEVMRVGTIDNDDMREYAFHQLQKEENKPQAPVWWMI